MGKTWVVVGNRVRARMLEISEDRREIKELGDFVNPSGRVAAASRGENRPPRVMDSTGHARHAIEPQTTPADKSGAQFARQLSTLLEDGRVHGQFDALALVATPRFLGQLRAQLSPALEGTVCFTLSRDMTRSTPEGVRRALAEPLRQARF